MPIKLNVGLAQKIGESNYGSRGASVNLELELDSSLALEPDKLRDRIRQMFAMVRASVSEELNGSTQKKLPAIDSTKPPTPVAAAKHSNGTNGSRANGTRSATPPQIKKLQSLVQDKKLDLDTILRERCRVQRPEELTVRQASDLIDLLKAPLHPQSV